MNKNIEDELLKLISEGYANVEIGKNTKLISGGLLDSYSVMELIAELEEHFNIDISLDDIEYENFNTITSIAKLVEKFQCSLEDK